DARLVADTVAERGQEAAAVLGPVVVHRLARLDMDEVAAELRERAGDRDPVVDRVAARMPVGHRQANGERPGPGGTHGLEYPERKPKPVVLVVRERRQIAA